MSNRNPGPFLRTGVVLLLSLLLVQPAFAADGPSEDSEIEALKRQVLDLQTRLEHLEHRIEQGVPVNMALEVEPVAGGWRKEYNWRLLSEGMTDKRVREILGEPDRQKTVKKFEFWYYGDGKVRVYMRRLKSWEIPGGIDSE